MIDVGLPFVMAGSHGGWLPGVSSTGSRQLPTTDE